MKPLDIISCIVILILAMFMLESGKAMNAETDLVKVVKDGFQTIFYGFLIMLNLIGMMYSHWCSKNNK